MSDDYGKIHQDIDSGAYFTEARRWFHSQYQAPTIEKAYCVLISCVVGATTFLSVSSFVTLMPISDDIPYIMAVSDVEEEIATLEALGEPDEDTNTLLLDYLTRNYVRWREGYDVNMLEFHIRKVEAMSTIEITREYRNHLSLTNPESPIILYESHTQRFIDILSVTFHYPAEEEQPKYPALELFDDAELTQPQIDYLKEIKRIPYGATVSYRAIEADGELESVSVWTAELRFDYLPLIVDQETLEVDIMKYTVTDYDIAKKRTTGNDER